MDRLVVFANHGLSFELTFGSVKKSAIFIITFVNLFKENATFKLHFVLTVLPCKKQNVTYIRFLYLNC